MTTAVISNMTAKHSLLSPVVPLATLDDDDSPRADPPLSSMALRWPVVGRNHEEDCVSFTVTFQICTDLPKQGF